MRPHLVQHREALPEQVDPERPLGEPSRRGPEAGGRAVRRFCYALLGAVLSLSLLAGSSGAGAAARGESDADLPKTVDPTLRHLFYLHGAWIERGGLERPHPVHGRYQYREIVAALAERGFVVISEARKGEIDPAVYAGKVATQVRRLLEAGVPPSHVTVIGHSKGGSIALITASELREEKVNFVIMAGCGKPGSGFGLGFERFLEERAANLRGRFLSIYDASDRLAGSCRRAFERAPLAESREVVLHTGLGHALFWSPRAAWIDEVVKWAESGS